MSCAMTTTGTVHVAAQLRQFRGGPRQLVLRYDVSSAAVDDFAGPFVQAIGDEQAVDVETDVATALTTGTCRVTAIDGSAIQADMVDGRRTF